MASGWRSILPIPPMIMKALLQLLALSSSAAGVAFVPARCHFAGCNIPVGSNGLVKANRRQSQHAFPSSTSRDWRFKRRSEHLGIVKGNPIITATAVVVLDGLEKELVVLPEQEALKTKFTELETILTREPFTDDAWLQSCEHLLRVAVSLANSVPSFSESSHLPAEHGAALSLVVRLTERCRRIKESVSGWDYDRRGTESEQVKGGGEGGVKQGGIPAGLHSSLKFCTKKNGLGKAAAEVALGVLPRYECIRERAKAIRGVERCLSEFCMVWSTARLLESRTAPATKRDFLFHLKAVLEHTPACHRHEAVLVLCRGLFTPATDLVGSTLRDHVHGAAFDLREGGYPLADAFAEVQEGASEHPRALRAARQAFPFLEILARWAWCCHLPLDPGSLPGQMQADGVDAIGVLDGVTGTVSSEGFGSESDEREATGGGATRGRGNTGVASLLVALARADPSGETIRSMQRWACEALVPEQVGEAPWSAIGTPVDRNEVARCLTCTRETFVIWEEAFQLRWMRSCREVGDILRLLVTALDDDGLEGRNLTSAVNHALFVTTFLRSMPEGAKARRGYERLIGWGRVPGDRASFSAERGRRERVTSWREAAEVLDLSMASILRVPEERVRSEGFRLALSSLLGSWRSPHALADFYNMHLQQKREVIKKYLRFLRALLSASDETLHDIRFKDPANSEHMQHMPERVRRLWEAEPCTLAGTSDPEVIFRMGEDTRSCMGIRRACCKTNGALLGYLLQGNVRFVGVQSALGRMEARAVLRLLLRADTMTPVLFMDEIYYSSHRDDELESQVVAEGQSVSDALGVPLYRAGNTVPGRRREDSSASSRDSSLRDDGLGCHAPQEGSIARKSKMCELIEVNGLSDFVYSDAPVGLLERAGMLQREPYPGQPSQRILVLAELAYAENRGE